MPEFLKIGAVKFFVYSREESRKHIHVRVREFEIKVWLVELEVAKSNAPVTLERKLLQLVIRHRKELIEAWNDFFGSER